MKFLSNSNKKRKQDILSLLKEIEIIETTQQKLTVQKDHLIKERERLSHVFPERIQGKITLLLSNEKRIKNDIENVEKEIEHINSKHSELISKYKSHDRKAHSCDAMIREARALKDMLSSAHSRRERAIIHQACEDIFGTRSPKIVKSNYENKKNTTKKKNKSSEKDCEKNLQNSICLSKKLSLMEVIFVTKTVIYLLGSVHSFLL